MIGQLVYSFILTVYYKTLTLLRVIPTDAAITFQLVAIFRCVMRAHFPVYIRSIKRNRKDSCCVRIPCRV